MSQSTSVNLHKSSHKRKRDGKQKLSFCIVIDKVKKYYPIFPLNPNKKVFIDPKFYVLEEDSNTYRIVTGKAHPEGKRMDQQIKAQKHLAESVIDEMLGEGVFVTHDRFNRRWHRSVSQSWSTWMKQWYHGHEPHKGKRIKGYKEEAQHCKSSIEQFGNLFGLVTKFEAYYGEFKTANIDAEWLREFQSWMLADKVQDQRGAFLGWGLGEGTVPKIMERIKMILNQAVAKGEILESPFEEFKKDKLRNPDSRGPYLQPEEVELLEKVYHGQLLIKQNDNGSTNILSLKLHHRLAAFLFVCYTGLRYSDLKQVEASNEHFKIYRDHFTIKMYKTKRTIEMRITDKMRSVVNLSGVGPVFKVPLGANNTLNNSLQKICELYGIGYPKIHGLRRTFASTLLNNNVPLKTVSELLGHGSIMVTEKCYAFLCQSSKDEAMEQVFGQSSQKEQNPSLSPEKPQIPLEDAYRLVGMVEQVLSGNDVAMNPELKAEMLRIKTAYQYHEQVQVA